MHKKNPFTSKTILLLAVFISLCLCPRAAQASPWAQNTGYFGKTGGKFLYGLKNVVFGWMMMFGESQKPEYSKEWEGFCVGISKSIVYTANGLVQLATFPVPVDFPDVGRGVYIPKREPPSSKKEKFTGIPSGKKEAPGRAAEKPQEKTEKPLPEKKIEPAVSAPKSENPPPKDLKPLVAPATQAIPKTEAVPEKPSILPAENQKALPPAAEKKPAPKAEPSTPPVSVPALPSSPKLSQPVATAVPAHKPNTDSAEAVPSKKDPGPAPETSAPAKTPASSIATAAAPKQTGPEKTAVATKLALAEPAKPAATSKPALAEPVKIMKEKTPTILISPPPPYIPRSVNASSPAYEPAKVPGIAPDNRRQPSIPAKREKPENEESETEVKDVSSLPSNEPLREPFFGGVKSAVPAAAEKFKAEETKPPAAPAESEPELLPEKTAEEPEEQAAPPAKTGAAKEGADKEDAMDEEILKILKEAEKYKQPK
jgi:hypothetical protein